MDITDIAGTPRKMSRTEQDSDSDEEEFVPSYETTTVPDVLEANEARPPAALKEQLQDWDTPIIFIVTKRTRYKLLAFLASVAKSEEQGSSSTNTLQGQGPSEVTTLLEQDQPNSQTVTKHTESSDTTDFDFQRAKLCRIHFTDTKKTLNNIRYSFQDEELKNDLNNEEDLKLMREVRKQLTTFNNFGNKTCKMIEQIERGETDYLFQTDTNIKPNRLNRDFVTENLEKIKQCNKSVNIAMFNQTIEDCINKMQDIPSIIDNTDNKLIAKAWRSIIISDRRNNNARNTYTHDYAERYNDERQYRRRESQRDQVFYDDNDFEDRRENRQYRSNQK